MIIFEKKLRNLRFQFVDFFYVRNCNQLQKLSVLTPEALRGAGGGGIFPLDFLALNFCCLTDYEKLW